LKPIYDTILVYLDNSARDANTIANACEFCKASNPNKVIFLNVVKDFNIPDNVLKQFPELVSNALIDREKSIKLIVSEYFDCNTEYDTLIRKGNELKEIISVSASLKSDLIIIGKSKESESVFATRLARRSPCSILIIPEGTKVDFSEIFVPVDFSDYSILSIEMALKLANDRGAKIYVENTYQIPSSYRYSGKSHRDFDKLMQENALKELQLILQHVEPGKDEIIPILSLDKGDGLVNTVYKEAKKKGVKLLVMGAKGKTTASAFFIGGKAERMIRINNSFPFLIIRKKGDKQGLIESYLEE